MTRTGYADNVSSLQWWEAKFFLQGNTCMSFYMDIIWPLESGPPSFEEANKLYEKLNFIGDTKCLARWFTECLMGAHCAIVARLELKPYSFAHMYELIEEDGEFPNGPDAWVSPDEMIDATKKLLSLIGNDDPDALVLMECFINENRTRWARHAGTRPRPRIVEGEDPFEVGLWRAQMLSLLLENLQGVIEAANSCKKEGMERIAFCYF